jgi:hypothetical protein
MIRVATVTCICVLGLATASGQQTPPGEPQSTPSFATAEQQAQFETAKQEAASAHWSVALAKLRPLHALLPDDVDLTRFTAEVAINSGDTAYALGQLKPLVAANAGNWQELMLMARAYAQAQDAASRDAALAALMELHASGQHPKLNEVQAFLIERIALPDGHIDLYYSLIPWSRYQIYERARIFDATGQQVQRITLESNDFDQPLWAQQHPKEAARGMRMFSMDAYTERFAPDGSHTQTHATYGFFDGRPSYDTVRAKVVRTVSGKPAPMSMTSGIPMPSRQ